MNAEDNNNGSKPAEEQHHELPNSELLARLSNYTLVNSLFQQYNNIKAASPLLKAGLETAEGTTQKLVGIAQPVLQPVITKLDESLHLDQTACKVLDTLETQAEKVATAYQHGVSQAEDIKTSAKDLVNKGLETVSQGREVAKDIVTSTYQHGVVETGTRLVGYANKPLNQIIDVTENLVNRLLPPELELEPLETDMDASSSEEPEEPPSDAERLAANPLPRIKQLGGGVSKRVQRAAFSKLQNLAFRTPEELSTMGYVVDLLQYAADYIDLDTKKQALKETSESVQHYFEAKKVQTLKLVSPAREIIEQQTGDLKESATKSVVAVVSAIAHATEVVRRQLVHNVPDLSQLQSNLVQITSRTKEAVLKLQEPHLTEYINTVRTSSASALESILSLITAYSPATATLVSSPTFQKFAANLQAWRDSLLSRLSIPLPLSGSNGSKKAVTQAEQTDQAETEQAHEQQSVIPPLNDDDEFPLLPSHQ